MPSNAKTPPKQPAKQPKPADLTDRQFEILEFIREETQRKGYAPNVREIGDHFGISSPNGVMCNLRALMRKGHLTSTVVDGRALGRSYRAVDAKKPKVAEIVETIAGRFPCFGEGAKRPIGNPIVREGKPPQFAAGVDVTEVVEFVLSMVK